jgi:pyruvate,water dikinase
MAVGCMAMVDAESSGVVYSTHPTGDRDTMIINATWGLGVTVVEGSSDTDLYVLRKNAGPEIIDVRQGSKELMATAGREGGVETVRTPEGMRSRKSLTEERARELARQAVLIERHFRKPQDIEWAIGRNGKVYILQTRPLRLDDSAGGSSLQHFHAPERQDQEEGAQGDSSPAVLLRDRGIVVQRGVGGGRAFIVRHPEELDRFPKGAVLVAPHDSSDYVRIMPYVSAIITDVGATSSHMASLCREFKVPTIVNTGDATQRVPDGHDITVYAEEGSIRIYQGIMSDLLDHYQSHSRRMEDLIEFRKKRYLLRYISPLNLVNPLLDNFAPEGCKTIHDIIRFIHEKSVSELVERSLHGSAGAGNRDTVRLDIPIPAGIVVVDIGGGLTAEKGNRVTLDDITSVPLRAIIRGMIYPGLWKSTAVPLKMNDFLSSMMRMPDIVMDAGAHAAYNLAVASREYANLNLRFGYHFTVVDCFCSETARNNHIYFRFAGGATDLTKRSRRVGLIAAVLKEHGFSVSTKGDLLIARTANLRQEEMEVILDQLGRLISYTRQMDAELHDDGIAERYARDFLEGRYCH